MWSINIAEHRWQNLLKGKETKKSPLVLVSTVAQQLEVRRACKMAQQAGIRIGMNLSLAKAHLPNVTVHKFDPTYDFKVLFQLATWAQKFSPLIGFDPELMKGYRENSLDKLSFQHYGFILDVSGMQKIYSNKIELICKLQKELESRHFEYRIAFANTIGAAWALSRYARQKVVVTESRLLQHSLRDLPVEALRVELQAAAALRELGIETVG
ncbi:MAG: DNA polymerase Y family protein, partial [Bdellovibrionales bacterium]|nr:DNA polymerase Y family protein [Bdellovibrionales bacterium]